MWWSVQCNWRWSCVLLWGRRRPIGWQDLPWVEYRWFGSQYYCLWHVYGQFKILYTITSLFPVHCKPGFAVVDEECKGKTTPDFVEFIQRSIIVELLIHFWYRQTLMSVCTTMEDVRISVTTQQEASSATAGRENLTSTKRTAPVVALSFNLVWLITDVHRNMAEERTRIWYFGALLLQRINFLLHTALASLHTAAYTNLHHW